MSSELIINASLPETRIALLEDGNIQELVIERAAEKGIVGNIYKGKVTRVLPGMQAAFVDIGLDKAAFLYVDDVYIHPEVFGEAKGNKPASMAELEADEDGEELEASDAADEDGDEVDAGEDSEENDGEDSDPPTDGMEMSAMDIDDDTEEDTLEFAIADVEEPTDPTIEISAMADVDDTEEDAGDSSEEDSESTEEGTDESESDEEDREPVEMGPPPEDDDTPGAVAADDNAGNRAESSGSSEAAGSGDSAGNAEGEGASASGPRGARERGGRGRSRRGGRGGRGGARGQRGGRGRGGGNREPRGRIPRPIAATGVPDAFADRVLEGATLETDRTVMEGQDQAEGSFQHSPRYASGENNRIQRHRASQRVDMGGNTIRKRAEFRGKRGRDRRLRSRKSTYRQSKTHMKIEDLLVEGQEVMVQVAKDPIAAKGARLTCHVSLAGRHLVCMPTIDHIGVSRRIDSDEERRGLREFVNRNRRNGMGFIVRTASGGKEPETWIKQDIDYLSKLWEDITTKARDFKAPGLVYEDLNPVLRATRDWVTEDVRKIIIDSKYYYNEVKEFVSHFVPALSERVELYHGDIPIFDAYGLSTELHRALERKVWLKSGGYIVVDQAEALVAIDINTGRYVGKKNLEDTILRTNMEAVEEIAYQLRLRNCGGIVIIDLIDMEKDENRQTVLKALELALQKDRARPTIVRLTDLGLVEMTRKRTRDTLVRALCQTCNYCEGKGYVKSRATVAYEVLREVEREGIDRDIKKVLVQAHPDIVDLLALEHRSTLDSLERKFRKQVYLQAIDDFHEEQFEVVGERSGSARASRSIRPSGPPRQQRKPRPTRGRRSRDDSRRGRGRRSASEGEAAAPAIPAPAPAAGPDYGAQEGLKDLSEEMNANTSAAGSEDVGNRGPAPMPTPAAPGSDDDMNEEDRLAFLRAQAAQDAALATNGEINSPSMQNRGGGGGRGGRGGGKTASTNGRRRPTSRRNGSGSGTGGGRSSSRNRRGRSGGGRKTSSKSAPKS